MFEFSWQNESLRHWIGSNRFWMQVGTFYMKKRKTHKTQELYSTFHRNHKKVLETTFKKWKE